MYMYVLLPVENGDDGDNGHLREEDKCTQAYEVIKCVKLSVKGHTIRGHRGYIGDTLVVCGVSDRQRQSTTAPSICGAML